LSPSISAGPTAAPTRALWIIPEDSEFSPLSTDDYTDVETITLRDFDTAIVDIGFAYNWFGEDLTQLVIQSGGQLFMDTSNDITVSSAYPIGFYAYGSRIAFANGRIHHDYYNDYYGGGAVKVGRKSGADESFKVSFEDVKWRSDGMGDGGDGEINVQVELFPNGDIIFCYGSGEMGSYDDDEYYEGGRPTQRMVAGVDNSDLDKHGSFPIPDDPFYMYGYTDEWPTDSCWKFQMPVPSVSNEPSPTVAPTSARTVAPTSAPTSTPSLYPTTECDSTIDCNAVTTFSELQCAVTVCSDIELLSKTIVFTEQIELSGKQLTFTCPNGGCVLDAESNSRIFYIAGSSNISFDGITFKNGRSEVSPQ
jgi:hypothetical protein